MIPCVRLWTSSEGKSKFEEGWVVLGPTSKGDGKSEKVKVGESFFEETPPGGKLLWHTAPTRQMVVTLSGILQFETRDGGRFVLRPGDILLAEDTTGSGHSWWLLDADPWRRMYVTLDASAVLAFESRDKNVDQKK